MQHEKISARIGGAKYEIPVYFKERVKRLLEILQSGELKGKLHIDEIITIICAYFGVDQNALKEDSRKGEIIMARRFICHFGRLLTPLGWNEIIKAAGRTNHATAYHHFREIGNLIEGFQVGDKHYQDNKIYSIYKEIMIEFFKQGLDPNKDYDWKKRATTREEKKENPDE
ncbi:MAG: hypothetical protein H8E34_10950 [Bacteroidetes bacterium]|nr:hypothetical protein [Bacteroidota bacterium]